MSRIPLRRLLLPFSAALVCLGLFAVNAHVAAGKTSGADAALPLMNYYDLDVEVVIKQCNPADQAVRKKEWHVRTDIWRDVPFDLTAKAQGEDILVRGTLSQAEKGRLRLAITVRRAGSDWGSEVETSIELVPRERVEIARLSDLSEEGELLSEEGTFVTIRPRAPGGLVPRTQARIATDPKLARSASKGFE